MAKDTGFKALAEEFKDYTNTKATTLEGLDETVSNLLDVELSMNLVPLGRRLAQEGDEKYSALLAEAGRRLAAPDTDGTQFKALNPIAKATVLHALDLFVAENAEIPEGCEHFDGLDVPSKSDLLDLINYIENSDGVALFISENGEESNDEESSTVGEVLSTYEPDTRNLAFKKSATEALSGGPLSRESVEKTLADFQADLERHVAAGSNKYGNLTAEGIANSVAKARKDFEDILSGQANGEQEFEAVLGETKANPFEAAGVGIAHPIVQVGYEKGRFVTVVNPHTGEEVNIPFTKEGSKTLIEMVTGKKLTPETLEKVTEGFKNSLLQKGATLKQAQHASDYIEAGIGSLL